MESANAERPFQYQDDVKLFKLYVGTKLIKGLEMDERKFKVDIKGESWEDGQINREGYLVVYPDGYQSWSPMTVFDNAYREVSPEERVLFTDTATA